MVDPCIIGDSYSERKQSPSQLFDAIERKLDEMMGAFRYHLSDHCCLDRTLTMVSVVQLGLPSTDRFENTA